MQKYNTHKEKRELPEKILILLFIISLAGTVAIHYFFIAPSGASTANPRRMWQLYLILFVLIFFAMQLPLKFIYNYRPKSTQQRNYGEEWWDDEK